MLTSSDDYLLLSGIQHMAFCPRQWALIHIEQQWAENVRTVEGKHLHERVDDISQDETRGNIRIVRSMPVISNRLGLRGVADVVEFIRQDEELPGETCRLEKRRGWWLVAPVEYKRGKPKADDRDAVQLCAQAMALEEMLGLKIRSGYLFYAQTRRRENVEFDETLRERVQALSEKMHSIFRAGVTPVAETRKHCKLCSLVEVCQPDLMKRHKPVAAYLHEMCDTGGETDA